MRSWLCTCFTINRSYRTPQYHSTISNLSLFIFQSGFTIRSFDADWENFEWNQDDHMEDLWSKGEAGVDFDSTPRIIEPEHFQCMFLIMGCIFSFQLIALLWDILSNKKFGFLKLMFSGLFACLLITCVNLYLFSTALWTPITYDTSETYFDSFFDGTKIATPARTISTEDYEYDMKMLVDNKTVVNAILGYGAVTSIIFIFLGMTRSIGKTHLLFIDLNI